MKPKRRAGGGPSARTRVGEEIRAKIGQLLLFELDDKRLTGVHVTRVEMLADLSRARVFWRATPGQAESGVAAEALERAGGFLRHRLGRTLRLKRLPELEFIEDSLEQPGLDVQAMLASLAAARGARPGDDDE